MDVGSCYIKVGFSSECRPRHILSLRDALLDAGLPEVVSPCLANLIHSLIKALKSLPSFTI